MKKILSLALVCVMLLGVAASLTSCGKILTGTYSDALGATTYKFSGTKVTYKGVTGGEYEGKYKVTKNDDGDQVIIFSDFDGLASFLNSEKGVAFGSGKDSEKGAYITIGGVKYFKQ